MVELKMMEVPLIHATLSDTLKEIVSLIVKGR